MDHNQLVEIKGFRDPWRFLSNFYYCKVYSIYPGGPQYKSTEHAYQAAKFTDPEVRLHIHSLASPAEAKRAGREFAVRADWDKIKYNVMEDLIIQKFSDEKLADLLLETGNAYLEETNTWGDVYWGVCRGVGQNNLGKILMQTRLWIRAHRSLQSAQSVL